jgi:chemotaxis protein MotB
MEPIPVGDRPSKAKDDDTVTGIKPGQVMKLESQRPVDPVPSVEDLTLQGHLQKMSEDLETAMQELIEQEMIRIERTPFWVEVEIKADILFPSGSAEIGTPALAVLDRIAVILAERPYPIRIEGHTDTRPIRTSQFPSNWELSAARAARIVRLFEGHGISPGRMVVAGLGENRPLADNTTEEGRNRNRRVTIVILGKPPAENDPMPGGITAEAVAAPVAAEPVVEAAP